MLDVSAIPEESIMQMVRTLYRGAKKAFDSDPEYRKAYEKWAAERKEKTANAQAE